MVTPRTFTHFLARRGIQPLRDRVDAGQQLAQRLAKYAHRTDVLVFGLPRGGVPVAYEIADALGLPLDVMIVRKLGVPWDPELAMGAITSGGICVLNEDIVDSLAISQAEIEAVANAERQELERRERIYRQNRPFPNIAGKIAILVDDGIATGATLRAAIAALRTQKPAKIIIAVGVAPSETCTVLANEVDELVCLLMPVEFWGVGVWFEHFAPTSDEEVRTLLERAWQAGDRTEVPH